MDLHRRTVLLERLRPFGLDATPPRAGLALPLVSLADFFTGNDDARSIGPQIGGAHPGVTTLHAMLQRIAARPDVSDVLIQAQDAQWAYDSDDEWVTASCVVVVTTADAAQLAEWKQQLGCAAMAKGFPQPLAPNAPDVPEDHAAWHLVWT
ncbi:hypothetical protein ACFJIW_18355 [Tahibacter sp. UC22_41]|uniref:hypothetical protein n=1 Tax=Tahibacter sp. UC22_41 TaxID=3350178 RepID=UPI0036D9D29A